MNDNDLLDITIALLEEHHLPYPYLTDRERSLVQANLPSNDPNESPAQLATSISVGFVWSRTPEGDSYWRYLVEKLQRM